MRHKIAAWIVLVLGVTGAARAQDCHHAPFSCAVDDAIERGLAHARQIEADTGRFGDDPRTNALGALAFLRLRFARFRPGLSAGFRGLDRDDQRRVSRVLAEVIAGDPALSGRDLTPDVLGTAAGMLALLEYLYTGGPDLLDGGPSASAAVLSGVRLLLAQQTPAGPWSTGPPDPARFDLPATAVAARALGSWWLNLLDDRAAAAAAEMAVARLDDPIIALQNPDGGTPLVPGEASDDLATAATLWALRSAGEAAGMPGPQGSLGWLRDHYVFQAPGDRLGASDAYLLLWMLTSALRVSEDDGLGGAVYAHAFADLQPHALGFLDEAPSAWFDAAHTLVMWQTDAGQWGTGERGGPRIDDPMAAHFLALLVLYRGVHYQSDADLDGLLGLDDNCPDVPNPDQWDEDQDGIGDACDNCRKVINRGQDDADGDGIGDVCDRLDCVPSGEEICDGIDNDCDGLVDRRIDGQPVVPIGGCATGLPGRCARGSRICLAGRETCRRAAQVGVETCDLTDEDCDGRIDEGTRNACGTCGPAPLEACNGVDDDCDGALDEDAPCPAGTQCRLGACRIECRGHGQCPADAACSAGVCVDRCARVTCAAGDVCDPATGICAPCVDCPSPDPCAACAPDETCDAGDCRPSCAAIACPADETCRAGRCVARTCGETRCHGDAVCIDEICVPNRCADMMCAAGEICVANACVADPCAEVRCPPHERCSATHGTAECVGDWFAPPPAAEAVMAASTPRPPGDPVRVAGERADLGPEATGGSADGCRIGWDRPASGAALLLMLLPLVIRRRSPRLADGANIYALQLN